MSEDASAIDCAVRDSSLLRGRVGLVMGLANAHSIAWGIADACARSGARLALTYQGAVLERRVRPLAQKLDSAFLIPCDVGDDASLDAAFAQIAKNCDRLDFVVHAIAFADRAQLKGGYVHTTAEAFAQALDISCYSFTAVAARAAPLMTAGGSLLTLSYQGSSRVFPNYNVMGVAKAALESSVRYLARDLGPRGIRVNALSAGPIKTLSSSGISDLRRMLGWFRRSAPLRRDVTLSDIGSAALYLLSDLSTGTTGAVHHVDCGYHVMGMPPLSAFDAPDKEETS